MASQEVVNNKGVGAPVHITSQLNKGVPPAKEGLTGIAGQVVEHEPVGITGITNHTVKLWNVP